MKFFPCRRPHVLQKYINFIIADLSPFSETPNFPLPEAKGFLC